MTNVTNIFYDLYVSVTLIFYRIFRHDYRKGQEAGVGILDLLERYDSVFGYSKRTLEYLFSYIFKKNQMELKMKNVFKQVQKALAICPSAEVLEKETPEFKFLRQNKTEISKHLLDIQKLYDQLIKTLKHLHRSSDDESSDENSDEDFVSEKAVKEKQSLIDEVTRLVKVMEDIAVDLSSGGDDVVDHCAKTIQCQLYDIKKGGPQDFGDGDIVEVNLDNLSEDQLKLTPFIHLTHLPHLPPEELGNDSKKKVF